MTSKPAASLDKTYQPATIEQRWARIWEEQGHFRPSGQGEAYSIMIPPPNVTGSLHMGHAFQDSIMDTLIRWQRMQGKNTLWQVGTDHAGIATQMLVERKLAAEEGKTRHDLGREKFLEKVWQWKGESGGTITRQLRRLGASVDWDRERFTLDEGFYKAVQEVFIRLYDEGLIYRGKRLVNWDPKLHTAISDLEVENREIAGHMWHFKYPLAGGETYEYIEKDSEGNILRQETRDYIAIATTRPETMLGDGAIAVHPDDERYAPLLGKLCEIPVGPKALRRLIPIITDEYPDPHFGSGAVKITGAHDFNDYQVAQRHNIPLFRLMDSSARMRDDGEAYAVAAGRAAELIRHPEHQPSADEVDAINLVPEEYRGLDRYEARRRLVAAIDSEGLMIQVDDKSIMQPYGDRSGVVIEPLLTDQWFVRIAPLAEPAIKAVENGDIQFVPKQYENMYFAWMRDIQDWCISRQLWWGHRIPAWYDAAGNIYVGHSEEAVRHKYNLDAGLSLTQDPDVLDTWFSSGLWTFGTLGWPEQTADLQTFHPTSVLVTGFDIIFFWVARMIMLTLKFTGQVPFRTVYVTGLIRDDNGQKMSKSKGNVLDPLDMIDGIEPGALLAKRTSGMMQPQLAEKIAKQTRKAFPQGISAHGTDALRFTLLAMASTGRDINWDMKRLEGYRNFCNKLWNAARYVLGNTEGEDCGINNKKVELTLADRWIITRLQETETAITRHLASFRFDLAASSYYEFVWNDYCDWYLELSKPVLWDATAPADRLRGTRRTLVRVLEVILRLGHPMLPFITEEIWQRVKPLAGVSGNTLMQAPWPVPNEAHIDAAAVNDIEWVKGVILAVRELRAANNLAPGKALPILINHATAEDQRRLADNRIFLQKLAKLAKLESIEQTDNLPLSAMQLVGQMEIHLPLAGFIDKHAEIARLQKEIDRLQQDIQRTEAKLGNQAFISKAPEAVVAREQTRIEENRAAATKLQEQQQQLQAL